MLQYENVKWARIKELLQWPIAVISVFAIIAFWLIVIKAALEILVKFVSK